MNCSRSGKKSWLMLKNEAIARRPESTLLRSEKLFAHLGHYPAAGDRFREALVNIQGGIPYQYAFRLCGFGEVLLVQDQIAESHDAFQESIDGMKIGEKWG